MLLGSTSILNLKAITSTSFCRCTCTMYTAAAWAHSGDELRCNFLLSALPPNYEAYFSANLNTERGEALGVKCGSVSTVIYFELILHQNIFGFFFSWNISFKDYFIVLRRHELAVKVNKKTPKETLNSHPGHFTAPSLSSPTRNICSFCEKSLFIRYLSDS